jgi:hypothetical protein
MEESEEDFRSHGNQCGQRVDSEEANEGTLREA